MILRVQGHNVYVRDELLYAGTSFFVPCLDPKEVRDQLNKFAKESGVKFIYKFAPESGVYGLRCWRTS